MVSLKQLRYLDALESHRHFGRAAEACHVSQPALSMQIAALEAELGVALVERLPREIVFTPRGLEIVARARAIVMAVNDLVDQARRSDQALVGSLRLGVIPSVAPYLLPRILPRLREEFPQLTLTLHETQTAALLTELQQARIDLALLALPSGAEGMAEMPLFDDPFVLALPERHPLCAFEIIDPLALRSERILLLEQGHCLRDQTVAFCQRMDVHGVDGLGATNLATLMQMVANGYGVTLLPQLAVTREAGACSGIALRPFSAPVPRRGLGLVWRRSSPRAADFTALGQLILDTAGAAASEPEPA
ncbi:LysR substrate-binding domain-containing protein [Rhodoligotrophos defluvii]|uniref:LysR substrate-binding domain-containing protein n=1 Tax=Rhodoligotrophos defluvii TaxID=2561934 RepID=UPI001484D455|nr:LysR substrate-binding domain-containing protein [Rhodoligotrophos defluvii]